MKMRTVKLVQCRGDTSGRGEGEGRRLR
jgi:hypothetical protein